MKKYLIRCCLVAVFTLCSASAYAERWAGDLDNDGELTVVDLVILNKMIRNHTADQKKLIADVDGDGKVTIADIAMLRDMILGKKPKRALNLPVIVPITPGGGDFD